LGFVATEKRALTESWHDSRHSVFDLVPTDSFTRSVSKANSGLRHAHPFNAMADFNAMVDVGLLVVVTDGKWLS
jgi:hypothetical protein